MQKVIKIILIFISVIVVLIVSFLTSKEPVTNNVFTLEEWNTLSEIYDKEIKEMGGITFQDVNFQELDKELDAIILERVQSKDDEYRELVEYLINKKHADSREN